MKYKKIKVIGIGLASIFCMFMINTQNVSAAKQTTGVAIDYYIVRSTIRFRAITSCPKWIGKSAPVCHMGLVNTVQDKRITGWGKWGSGKNVGNNSKWGRGNTFYSGENAAKDDFDVFEVDHGTNANPYVIRVKVQQYGYDSKKPTCSNVPEAHKVAKNHWVGDKYYPISQELNYTAKCSDTGGSGCKDGNYSVKIPAYEMVGTAKMSDKATYGNKDTCTVERPEDDYPPDCDGYTVENQYTWATSKTAYGYCRWDNAGCDRNYVSSAHAPRNGTYRMSCRDISGNIGYVNVVATKIDPTPPSCNGITYPDASYWYRTNVTVKSACYEAANGYDQSGCSQGTFREVKNTSQSSGSVGIRDIAGNYSSCGYNGIKFDTTGPSVDVSYGDGYTQMNNQNQASDSSIPVVISASDGQAGVRKVCYKLSGAMSKGETCVGANSTTIYVNPEGTTTVTAWAYDNARDYNTSNDGVVDNGGNRSSDVSKNVYIDRTSPTINFTTGYDGSTWVNTPQNVAISLSDAGAGIGKYYYYWSTSNGDAYDESTSLYRSVSGNVVATDETNNYKQNLTRVETHPANNAHNDVIYLHVKACDRAFYSPNCRTATFKTGIHFDNMKPYVIENIPNERLWVNKLQVEMKTSESIQAGKQNSGIDSIYTYWDVNQNHVEDGKTKDNSNYSSSVSLSHTDIVSTYRNTFNWTIDFANLKNVVRGGGIKSIGAAEEGSRFIKTIVKDKANNNGNAYLSGPYQWDTTKPKNGELHLSGPSKTFKPA